MTRKNEEGFPVLGWLVSWSTRDFSIERAELVKALDAVGIDVRVAREVLPKNAAIRATRQTAKGSNSFHRKVADQEHTAAFVVASTSVTEQFDAEFTTNTKVVYDKSQRQIVVKGQKKKEIEEAFERNKIVYAGDQFRSIVLRYIKRYCNAVTYLETGNVYFVPVLNEDSFNKLQALFDLLKIKGVKLSVKEEISTKQTRGVFWGLTVGEISGQIKKMKEDLEILKDADSDVKDSSIAVRLKKYADLKLKVECYETALQSKAVDLRTELESLTTTAKSLLT